MPDRKIDSPVERLVDLMYELPIDPELYDKFMQAWDELALRAHPVPGDDQTEQALDPHFERAFMLLEKVGRVEAGAGVSLQALLDSRPGPAFAISSNNVISAANAKAETQFSLTLPMPHGQLPFDAEGIANLQTQLLEAHTSSQTIPLLVRNTENQSVLLVLRLHQPSQTVVVDASTPSWHGQVDQLLQRAFSLTPTESQVCRQLYEGLSIKDIASVRNRSEETVRSHIKTLFNKTTTRNQAELMRLLTGLVFTCSGNSESGSTVTSTLAPREQLFGLADGRVLAYYDIGPRDGQVVVFLHGMLDDPYLPESALALLVAAGVRLIGPSRPAFGRSSPDPRIEGAPRYFAEDLAVLLDTLHIERAALVGHMAGSLYAFAAAAQMPALVSHIVNISGGVPIIEAWQIDRMTPRQRLAAQTAKYAPSFLRLVVRAGVALIDSGREDKFIEALHGHTEVDRLAAERDEVAAHLAAGYRFTITHGHQAFYRDAMHTVHDWSELLTGFAGPTAPIPVTLIHGRHDPVVIIDSLRDLVERYPCMTLDELEDGGQLILYERPTDIATRILAAIQR